MLSISAQASTDFVKVGLFHKQRIAHVVVTFAAGGYDVYAEGNKIYSLEGGKAVQIAIENGKVSLKSWSEPLGTYSSVVFKKRSWSSAFKLKCLSPQRKTRTYRGNLEVRPNGSKLKIVNNVYLDHYVEGVVEAEAGKGKTAEYYKVQAIICRTYALSNLYKFSHEGYNLCDAVDCQVYKGISKYEPLIPLAVQATKGMVVVDGDIKLITAAFHSNSGGFTMNSEHVWAKPVTYLRARVDSFSLGQPHFNWEKEVPKKEWIDYLAKKHRYPTSDEIMLAKATLYDPKLRNQYLIPEQKMVALREVRRDWGLRSTFFSIHDNGDTLTLKGKGFGHGVGLSQEGAMRMAELGYTFTDILHYYYKDVHLVDLSVIDFFRED